MYFSCALFGCTLFVSTAPAQETLVLPSQSRPVVSDSVRKEVRLLAIYQPGNFTGFLRLVPNYHLLVWENGHAVGEALFRTAVPDTALLEAFESIGAQAGNNLTMDAWNKRNETTHPAPQTRIAGTPMEIFVRWEGLAEPRPLVELLEDPGKQGFDFRFGGNRALIHHWHSGCLVCLYSCPGSKVGNAAYTVRDYATRKTKFIPKKEGLPQNGSPVIISFRLKN